MQFGSPGMFETFSPRKSDPESPGSRGWDDDSNAKYTKSRGGDGLFKKAVVAIVSIAALLAVVLLLSKFGGSSKTNTHMTNESAPPEMQLRKAWEILEAKCSKPDKNSEVSCCLGDSTCTWATSRADGRSFTPKCVTTEKAAREKLVGSCGKGLGGIQARPSGAPPQMPRRK
jgi:hypothetical protein